jgi:hypothetical protein
MITRTISQYRVVKKLADVGMEVVYKAPAELKKDASK